MGYDAFTVLNATGFLTPVALSDGGTVRLAVLITAKAHLNTVRQGYTVWEVWGDDLGYVKQLQLLGFKDGSKVIINLIFLSYVKYRQ